MIVAMVGGLALLLGGADGGAETYEARRAAAGRDARSQVDLALWCESNGLEREKLRHLSVAVLTDPSHAMARALLGLVEYRGKWQRPEAIADAVKVDVAASDLLAEYNGKRVAAPLKVDAQMKLAAWCTEKGLTAEAHAHHATVVRLDPDHAEAWKKLGYKKAGTRWVTEAIADAEKADREAQAAADKAWQPRLARLRDDLGKSQSREKAEAELAGVTDPRAVPMAWKVFVEKGEAHHLAAVQLLGQIDAAASSRALATLAVSARHPEVRRRATETLRRRDPREWASALIVMLREKIKYEVKPVGGPGSPGQLFIEGEKANTKRLYAPPSAPTVVSYGRDTWERDEAGLPVLVRHSALPFDEGLFQPRPFGAVAGNPVGLGLPPTQGAGAPGRPTPAGPGVKLPAGVPGDPATLARLAAAFDPIAGQQFAAQQRFDTISQVADGARIFGRRVDVGVDRQVRIPVGQMAAEAERVAASAQRQLQADVDALDAHNRRVAEDNAFVAGILKAATGESIPDEPQPWKKWFVDQLGFVHKMTAPGSVPTVVESVPLDDQPRAIPVTVSSQYIPVLRHSCFAKGTPVRTMTGPRPIETLNVGDLVLAQDTKTGKLAYRPVVMVHHNPPSPTFKVDLDGQGVVTSPSHRFWKAGQGWVMARDLKVGDPIRTLGGVAKVTAVDADKVQPVFNLDVADDADFFAGEAAALVHDNTLPDLRQLPFDAPAAVARR